MQIYLSQWFNTRMNLCADVDLNLITNLDMKVNSLHLTSVNLSIICTVNSVKMYVSDRKRHRLKRLAIKVRKRIQNSAGDCQRKAIECLCKNYHLILLLAFETSNIVKKENRKEQSDTWSYYKFQCRLINKTKQYANCKAWSMWIWKLILLRQRISPPTVPTGSG
jgi:hypothetical protein